MKVFNTTNSPLVVRHPETGEEVWLPAKAHSAEIEPEVWDKMVETSTVLGFYLTNKYLVLEGAAPELRQDGPTIAEFVAAGYPAESYPPAGYAPKSSAEEIAAAIEGAKSPLTPSPALGGAPSSPPAPSSPQPAEAPSPEPDPEPQPAPVAPPKAPPAPPAPKGKK